MTNRRHCASRTGRLRPIASITMLGVVAAVVGLVGCGDASTDPSTDPSAVGAAAVYSAAAAQIGALGAGQDPIAPAEAAALGPTVERIIAASSEESCDFGVEYRIGMMAELPHLAQQRQLAAFLAADANRLADEGDLEGAARRTAAIVRMATQVGGGGGGGKVVIERVVAMSLVHIATGIVAKRPELRDAAWKTDISNALAQFRSAVLDRAPHFVADETAIFAPWLRTASDTDMRTLADEGLRYRTAAERGAAADTLERFGVAVTEAWRSRGATTELERLKERARADGIEDLAPPVVALRSIVERTSGAIADAQRALR